MGGKRYSRELRDEVLSKIRSGKKVAVVAEEHGLIEQTVRNWLYRDTGGKSGEVLELSRLRRENAALLSLVGRLTLEGSTREKNHRRERRQ